MIEVIQREKNFGYISLFTRSGLAIKTFNVTIALVASNFVYYQASWPSFKSYEYATGLIS